MLLHKFLNTVGPDVIILIRKINFLNRDLIGSYGITIIRDSDSHIMMAARNLHIPSFIFVGEKNAVTLSRAVFFNQLTEKFDAFTRRMNKRCNHMINSIFRNTGFYQRIIGQNSGIAVYAFSSAHSNMDAVDTGLTIFAFNRRISLRHVSNTQRFFRQIDSYIRVNGMIGTIFLQTFSLDGKDFRIYCVMMIFISGNHQCAVDAGFFSDN